MRADLIRTILVSAILLLLGAAAPVAAVPVPISGSARLELFNGARGTFTVGPDRYGVAFFNEPHGIASWGCHDGSGNEGCRAGAFIGAAAEEGFGDVFGGVFRGGQETLGCDSSGRPRNDEPHGRCVVFGLVQFSWGAVQPLPPLPSAANTEAVVASTFRVLIAAGIFLDGDATGDGFGFQASGPGRITVARGQEGLWEFRFAEARIDPLPEPATLLLFGTTAAGLGVARWVKRRRTSDHAA
jgi:hypothetical protein